MDLDTKRKQLQDTLQGLTDDAAAFIAREDFDAADETYTELKRDADKAKAALGEIDSVIAQRQIITKQPAKAAAKPSPATVSQVVRQMVAEYPGYGRSANYHVPDLRRELLDSSDVAGVNPDYIYQQASPLNSTPLLDAGSVINVGKGQTTIKWLVQPGGAPLADVVAEGAQKPEAAISWTETSVELEVLAHYSKLTRQLYNIGGAYDFIMSQLVQGVDDKMEALAAAAVDGATGTLTAEGATLLESIRVGVAECSNAGHPADTVLLNPADYAALDNAVMANAGTGPEIRQTFWGLRVVAAGAVTAGTAWVGNFKRGLVTFRYPGVDMFMTDSDISNEATSVTSDFRGNILTALAETTAKSAIVQPLALCKCTTTP